MKRTFADAGVEMTGDDWAFFERLRLCVIGGNSTMNLTRLTAQADFYIKHVLDSLLPFQAAPSLREGKPGQLVADLGSGAGFPGFAVAYFNPSWDVALIERTQKKAAFLEETAATLGLDNIFVLPMDAAECAAHVPLVDHKCDLVLARAVGRIGPVTRAAVDLLKTDGRIAHYKGGSPSLDELDEGAHTAHALGMLQMEPVFYELPPDAGRSIILTLNLPNGRKRGAKHPRTRARRGSRGDKGQ
ncbi:MAG: 16S rRNA (guanine(527)-N(7))-methyltransferase RsmG [Planctomycetota bacterium]|nr:16S rRNA (guanine(527)-N(7))-methyltransferase RsmG [Planctomycetota bacterium]